MQRDMPRALAWFSVGTGVLAAVLSGHLITAMAAGGPVAVPRRPGLSGHRPMGRRRRARAREHSVPARLRTAACTARGAVWGLAAECPGRGGAPARADREFAGGSCGGLRCGTPGNDPVQTLVGGRCSGAHRSGTSVAVERFAHRVARDAARADRARGGHSGRRRNSARNRRMADVGQCRTAGHAGGVAPRQDGRAGGRPRRDGSGMPHRPPCLDRPRRRVADRRNRDDHGAAAHRYVAGSAAQRSSAA